MSTSTPTEREQQSFAETALRMGGKTEEEARRTGAVDKADEQVEQLFKPQYQTANSPIHKAVWEDKVPLDMFAPPPLAPSHPSDKAMGSVHRTSPANDARPARSSTKTAKLQVGLMQELADAGYWGMLIDPKYGGQGAPFARFTHFLTRMATYDSDDRRYGLGSRLHRRRRSRAHVRQRGAEAERSCRSLADGQSLSGFALTEPCAGSDLTALKTTAVLEGDDYVVNGEKLFITNAIRGRTVGLVVPDRQQAGRADRRSARRGERTVSVVSATACTLCGRRTTTA